jgi:hypothetical protein
MKWFIFAVIAIILWAIKNAIFKKIDEDEQRSLSTPGRANFIREHYQGVIDYILSNSEYQIIFERTDAINIGTSDKKEYLAIYQSSGGLLIAFIKYSSVQKEWHFSRGETEKHIIYELQSYI